MLMGIGLSPLLVGCEANPSGVSADNTAGEERNTAPHTAPVVRMAWMTPVPLTRNAPLEVHVEAEAPNLGPVTIQYQWIVNGAPVAGATHPTFDPASLNPGDRVSVDLTPIAATGRGPLFHVGETSVHNSPPMIKAIAIQPTDARVTTPLQAVVEVVDADHDPVRLTFQWRRNEYVVKEGDDDRLVLTDVRVGDIVIVEATAADRHGMGRTARSTPVTIQNSPPSVTTAPPTPTNRDHYEYAVRASDPDGDPLRFRLASAPSGMTIGEASGLIVWRIPPGLKGAQNAQIVIEDNRGGSVVQDIQLTLPAPAES
jgi:hypothetical protein